MKAGPGQRLAQIIELWKSGELERAATSTRTQPEMAALLGMTTYALADATERARKHGYPIPPYSELRRHNPPSDPGYGEEWEDEPTRPNIRQAQNYWSETRQPAIGMHTASVQHESYVNAPRFSSAGFQGSDLPPGKGGAERDKPKVDVSPFATLPTIGSGPARSTLIRPDGSPVLQWIKHRGGSDPDEIIDAAKRGLADISRAAPSAPPQYASKDLLSCIVVGDAHFGMLAWGRETGESFNLQIAERDLLTAIARLVDLAPAAGQSLLVNIGDFVHADSEAATTTKGTRVDVDSRWPRVIETAVRAKRQCIGGLLTKSGHVHDINVRGNHDSISSVVMSIALAQFYENEPRVTVDTSPGLFNFYRFGATLLGFHHGHTVKPVGLAGVMSVRRAKDWGETKYRRWYNGHYHSQRVHEVNGVIVEHVPTLAALDAWAAGQGYDAMREIRLDVYHRRLGLIQRHIVNIDEIRELQEVA